MSNANIPLPSPLMGICNSIQDANPAADVAGQVGISIGGKLNYWGQTANTGSGSVANQAIGAVQLASGTATSATFTVSNTMVTGNSYIFYSFWGDPGVSVTCVTSAVVAATSFTIKAYINGTTTANTQILWIMFN